MNMAVLTTAFFPREDVERQLKMFLMSAHKYNVQPIVPYGIDEPYCIWAEMKIRKKLPVFKALMKMGFTHVLYTDARDAFWTGSFEEVKEKYEAIGAPECLASTERNCNPNSKYVGNYPTSPHGYDYHCVGGYIAELPWILEKFTRMDGYLDRSGDDAEIWQWAWDEGWFRPELDWECRIFQTITSGAEDHLKIDTSEGGNRLHNWYTDSHPCILHMNGGFSSPTTGKWDYMKLWWDKVHPEMKGIEP